jgi:F-type H+-transporting ATPase subunit delta
VQIAWKERLVKLTGKKVRIDFETDPDLLGGVVTRIGSTVYDGSVQNQLQRMKKEKMIG